MAPSRGLSNALQAYRYQQHSWRRSYSSFTKAVTTESNKTQIYISRSLDPYVNLSIEHFLLQKSPPESTILFLYTDRPSIVIGRNQNPWLEVNLGLLRAAQRSADTADLGDIDLVRRRSGGGTVFHDEGNVNYSVICPTALFDRDKHAEMVVRALHGLGVERAKVNERHDIVLDRKPISAQNDPQNVLPGVQRPLKISGSAYKLTRLRSVHHGTCLLSSPNIKSISQYLRSPAKQYIKARGVDSVSSPIANVNVANEDFEEAVVREFEKLYSSVEAVMVTEAEAESPEIVKGLTELRSLDWTYLQTPQFTFSTHKTEDDSRERPPLPKYLPEDMSTAFTARNGVITEAYVSHGNRQQNMDSVVGQTLVGKKVHEIEDWRVVFASEDGSPATSIAKWMNSLFGKTAA